MDLESVSNSVSNLMQASALVVGGAWAYLKFLRGRTFSSRARLEMTADTYQYGGDPALLVHVSMHNEGLSKIDLRARHEKFVRVDAIASEAWLPDTTLDWDEDQTLITRAIVFDRHEWIEPNETIDDHLLIPVATPGRSDPVAYRLRARVTQPPSSRWPHRQTRSTASAPSNSQAEAKEAPAAAPRKAIGQTWSAVVILPVALTPTDSTAETGHSIEKGEVPHEHQESRTSP